MTGTVPKRAEPFDAFTFSTFCPTVTVPMT
jgi:hypothetical protein